jgi:DNA-binding MarR family transcriptional regulator
MIEMSTDAGSQERDQSRARSDQRLYEGLADFRLVMRRFLASSEAIARSAGVTTQQYQAMLVIKARSSKGIILKELAAEMLLAPNGAVQLIDRMERLGLVRRRPSPTDGRSVIVSLTSQGSRALRRLAANHLTELMRGHALLVDALERLAQLQKAVRPDRES